MSNRSTSPRPSVLTALLTLSLVFGVLVPSGAQEPGLTIRWTYIGDVPAEARFTMENEIGPRWAEVLSSPVPIDIEVTWAEQATGILASAGAAGFRRSDAGPVPGAFYPVALLEAFEGVDSDSDSAPEIEVTINDNVPWDYSVGSTDPDKFDFVGTVLHEVAHGLGFGGFLQWRSDGTGHYFGTRTVYDSFIADANGNLLLDTYAEDSQALGDALTSNALFWSGAEGTAAAGGNDCGSSREAACPTQPKIHAPTNWVDGSSIVHWDERTYPAGHANALMTPTAVGNETAQTIGPMTIGMMYDMGWPAPGSNGGPTDEPTEQPTDQPTSQPGGTGQGGFDGNPATTQRIGSNGPASTAIQVSRARFPDDAAFWVVLSRDDVFADSLSGTPLTSDGPLLLTPTEALTDAVRDEINRVLLPGDVVYLLGGVAALSQDIEDELELLGYDVRRLAGANRFETSLAIADEVRFQYGDSFQAIVARAFGTDTNPTAGWADSVTAGAYAAFTQTPILLSPTSGLTDEVDLWLTDDDPSVSWVVGGQAALSDQVQRDVPKGVRVFGQDRAATAVAIATRMWRVNLGEGRFAVVDGFGDNGWAFGLAAAGLAADGGAPLLPVARDVVPQPTADALTSCGQESIDLLVIGGEAVVGGDVVSQLDNLDGTAC